MKTSERGFTLIELMISLVLFSIAIIGVLSVAVTMTQGYREQRQAIAVEAAVRGPLDFLADAIRQSSPGVSDPSKLVDFHTCQSGALVVTNSFGPNGEDKLDLFYASGGVLTSTTDVFDASSTSLKVTDASKLSAGDAVIVTDFTNGVLVRIASISGNTLTLTAKCGTIVLPVASFAAGSVVVRAQHAHFTVGSVDGIPTLMMDPDGTGPALEEPFAEGIEDMQIAVAVESNSVAGLQHVGTAANDDEWHFNVAGDTPPLATAAIRAVRITLIARTTSTLFGNQSTFFFRPKAEDHAAGLADGYRRRVLTTTVELRNVSGSP